MNDKSTIHNNHLQHLPAGISPTDPNIEFVGQPKTKTVLWFRYGNAHAFSTLPNAIYQVLEELFLTDLKAVTLLSAKYFNAADDIKRLTELYTYYMYGQLDSTPDVIDGYLQPCENFRESKDCLSLAFDNKYIDINGIHLAQRDLKILDMMMDNLPDKVIAYNLGISQSTFDFHKKKLYRKIGVDSKVDFVVHGLKAQILCEA